ncbi:hypothetical protein [Photorhabdus namnaonensis]|uniref:hypothetical protein n=1 Tax=Photorhabdus namnaonensis TaxID=1851568 RepID=UPI000808331E|nr:hypothetical protein [Photorhabdus namnaonensis]
MKETPLFSTRFVSGLKALWAFRLISPPALRVSQKLSFIRFPFQARLLYDDISTTTDAFHSHLASEKFTQNRGLFSMLAFCDTLALGKGLRRFLLINTEAPVLKIGASVK